MKQVITFRIEVDHPTLLKPEGEWRGRRDGEHIVIEDGSNKVTTCRGSSVIPHLVVFPQPSAAVRLAELVKKHEFGFTNSKHWLDVIVLADKVLAEERSK